MKSQITALIAKIDALTLRERVILFMTILACTGALVNVFWLEPAMVLSKKLQQQATTQESELKQLRGAINPGTVREDPSKTVRDEIAQSQQRIAAINVELGTLLPTKPSQEPLEQVLVQFLRRYEGLTLMGVKTLGEATPVANSAGLTKRTLELRVSGPYAALVGYVQALEAALPSLRWGSMVLKADAQPPELTLQVFVLGVQTP